MNLPNGHLSPSAVSAYIRCGYQFYLFRIKGHIAPPEIALEVGKETHRVVLDVDLTRKLQTGANAPDEELIELYLDGLKKNEYVLHAPSLDDEGGLSGLIDREAKGFPKIIAASRPWRHAVGVESIEAPISLTLGSVPVEGRIDLVEPGQVTDLKRRRLNSAGRRQPAHTADEVGVSLQLVPYAVAAQKRRAGFVSLCDVSPSTKDIPEVVPASAEITVGQVERVTAIYEGVAASISAGIFTPVDKSGASGWACSARWCGAWRMDAVDFVTGQAIGCPHGQKSQVAV